MNSRGTWFHWASQVAAVVCLAVSASGQVSWKQQVDGEPTGLTAAIVDAHRTSTRTHWVVAFSEPVSPERAATAGLMRIGPAPLDQWLAVADDSSTWWNELPVSTARWVTQEEKWSPLLDAASVETVGENDLLWLVVSFHPDVDSGSIDAVLRSAGITAMERTPLLSRERLVTVTRSEAKALLHWDEVAYLFPASVALRLAEGVETCPGALGQGFIGQQAATVGDGWDGPGLGTAALTYWLGDPPKGISGAEWAAAVRQALGEWSSAVAVDFALTQLRGQSRSIDLWPAAGDHGDGYPFDGPRGVLAHTFYPTAPDALAGDVHLDNDESWRIGANTDLFSVVLHELGHSLGLGHSDNPGSVMYPYYRLVTGLSEADRQAARTLYAARVPAGGGGAGAPVSLILTTPAAGEAQVSAATFVLEGQVKGGTTAPWTLQWVNEAGGDGVATVDRAWKLTLPLVPGLNTLHLRVSEAGVTSAVTVKLFRQTAPPVAPPAAPPQLTVDPPVLPPGSATIRLTGTASHASGIKRVTWQLGTMSGTATGTATWTIPSVPLGPGNNVVAVTAESVAGTSVTATVTMTVTMADKVSPSLTITNPSAGTLSTSAASYTLRGTATDTGGVERVTWQNGGASGLATGTNEWAAVVPLVVGINNITIRAEDKSGNATWRQAVIRRR